MLGKPGSVFMFTLDKRQVLLRKDTFPFNRGIEILQQENDAEHDMMLKGKRSKLKKQLI